MLIPRVSESQAHGVLQSHLIGLCFRPAIFFISRACVVDGDEFADDAFQGMLLYRNIECSSNFATLASFLGASRTFMT